MYNMRLKQYSVEQDGFCGLFSPIERNRNAAVIVLEDGHPDSYVVKTAMKWLNRSGVSAMGVGPEKYMKGVHNWPLENVENAVKLLRSQGYDKVGVIGSSFGSNMALSAAARIPEITLTIALTPMDWVYWGISRMKKKIEESENSCNLEVLIYDHCGHFIFPESMMQLLLPRFLVDLIIPRVFSDAKGFVKECRKSRIDLDKHIQSTIKEWINSSKRIIDKTKKEFALCV